MSFFFFFNDTATTEIYTLSLHDALPIWSMKMPHCWKRKPCWKSSSNAQKPKEPSKRSSLSKKESRSEEHTSELQSHLNLVCRLLLEKKKQIENYQRSLYNNHPTLSS